MKYRKLGDTGVFVSQLCLGAMTFGSRWEAIGALGQNDADELVHRSLDAGINFFDTANVYSLGDSEEILGKSLARKRQDVVIATKVRGRMGPGPNEVGLSRLHIIQSVEASLKRLGTDYIEETLTALTELVRSGKVRYIGCSNLPAWELMRALGVSRQKGLELFKTTQSYYSLVGRELERETIPLLDDQGLGLLVWSPLAGGFLSGKFSRSGSSDPGARRATFKFPPVDETRGFDIIDAIRLVATAHEVSIAQIALAWLLHKTSVTSVIIGAKRIAQLDDNLSSIDVALTSEEMKILDDISTLQVEYPNWMDSLGDDRLPGELRDLDALTKK